MLPPTLFSTPNKKKEKKEKKKTEKKKRKKKHLSRIMLTRNQHFLGNSDQCKTKKKKKER